MPYNLVVSTGRWRERQCIRELVTVAEYLGYRVKTANFAGFPGLVTALIEGNAPEFCEKLREAVIRGEVLPRFILKAVPLERNIETDIKKIVEEVSAYAREAIGENETYKIEVRYRGLPLDRRHLIDEIAARIGRKVKLEDPDKIVFIEIFPKESGYGVVKPTQIFSLVKALRERRRRV